MKKILLLLFRIILIPAGLYVGLMQGGLLGSDYGAGESLFTRLWMSVGIAVSVGVVFGYFLRSYWWLAIVSVWMTIFFVFFNLIAVPEALLSNVLRSFAMLLPIAAVLGSAYLGAWFERRGRGRLVLLVILIGILGVVGSILFVNLSS